MLRFWLILGLLAVPAAARAAACCLSTSAFGAGRLAIWEEAAFGLSSSFGTAVGSFDQRGKYLPFNDYEDRESRLLGWGILRLSPSLEASLRLPWVFGTRAAAGRQESGSGPGDLAAGIRWELLPLGTFQGIPGVALTLGGSAPTGRSPGESRSSLGSDITSRGAWTASAGLSLEKAHDPWFVRLDVAGIASFPATTSGGQQRFGPAFEATLGGGVEVVNGLVVSLAPRVFLEGELEREHRSVAGSDVREAALGGAVAWKFDPHWTLQAGVDQILPIDGFSKNRQVRTLGQLGLRAGVF